MKKKKEEFVRSDLRESYPKYLLYTDGEPHLHSVYSVGAALDNGWAKVTIGDIVMLDVIGTCRRMTEKDRQMIENRADEYSGNK